MIELEKPKMVTADISDDGRYGKLFGSRLKGATALLSATAFAEYCCPHCRAQQ